jgi:hypothetical protein
MAGGSIERLGIAVKARRDELGLTQPVVHERGGPSIVVQSRVENNDTSRGTGIRAATLDAFDTALRWRPGSAHAVYATGEPPKPLIEDPLNPDTLHRRMLTDRAYLKAAARLYMLNPADLAPFSELLGTTLRLRGTPDPGNYTYWLTFADNLKRPDDMPPPRHVDDE